MFDIGFAEIIVISAVTLVVVGPKEIPNVVRGVVKGLRRLRGYVNEFQSGVTDFVDSTGVNDLKDDLLKDDKWDDFAVGGAERPIQDPYPSNQTNQTVKKAKKKKAKKASSKKSTPKKSKAKKSVAKKSAPKKSVAKKSNKGKGATS